LEPRLARGSFSLPAAEPANAAGELAARHRAMRSIFDFSKMHLAVVAERMESTHVLIVMMVLALALMAAAFFLQ
jgi:hypothetical protein